MKDRHDNIQVIDASETSSDMPSALDLLRRSGGRTRKVGKTAGKSIDSMLAVYKDRVTYTFIANDEVASIHFDRSRGEIFFKGHNVYNMDLADEQIEALRRMESVMAADKRCKPLLPDYSATLARLLADK
jgi:hypothetical protein